MTAAWLWCVLPRHGSAFLTQPQCDPRTGAVITASPAPPSSLYPRISGRKAADQISPGVDHVGGRPRPALLGTADGRPFVCRVHHIPGGRPRRPLLLFRVQPGLPRGAADGPHLSHQHATSRPGDPPTWLFHFGPCDCHYARLPQCCPPKNGNLPFPPFLGALGWCGTPAPFQLGPGFSG